MTKSQYYKWLLIITPLAFVGCEEKESKTVIDPSLGVTLGEVIEVPSGDAIIIRDRRGQKLILKLYGVDAPELGQPYGSQAQARVQELIFGKRVSASIHKTDREGSPKAVIWLGTEFHLHTKLLNEGLAKVNRDECKNDVCQFMLEDEKAARIEEIGLWSSESSTKH